MTLLAAPRATAASPATVPLNRWAALILVFVVTSRGPLEMFLGKPLAYGIQAAAAVALLVLLRRHTSAVGPRPWGHWAALLLFVITALLSVLVTTTLHSSSAAGALFYTATMLLLVGLLFFGSYGRRDGTNIRTLGPVSAIVAMTQLAVAVAQQYGGLRLFPGSDVGSFADRVRPAGLTGSYLHYPLVMALFAIILLGVGLRTRRASTFVCAALSAGAVMLSLSRSGMMILALTLIVAIVLSRFGGTSIALLLGTAYVSIIAVLWFRESGVISRALSAFDPDSSGNAGRFAQWNEGVEAWMDTRLLLGEFTGMYTNATRNFGLESLGVVESSLLQQMLNFGLIGALFTYWLLLAVPRTINPSDTWVRAGAYACVAQTLVYQSVEVLPFVVLFSLLPLVFTADQSANLEEVGRDA